MKAVKVTYTTQAAYAPQNSLNIQRVMEDLQKMNDPSIHYHACLGADGKTFIHTAFFREESDEKKLFALPAFKNFQEQLKASSPEKPPQQELLSLVGSSYTMFK
jgi:hypothetical protein